MKKSAGIIPYVVIEGIPHFLLGYPGGPYYCSYDKDLNLLGFKNEENRWSILKGGIDKGETKKEAALREFREESGFSLDDRKKELINLEYIKYKSGKRIYAYGIKAFFDVTKMHSNNCTMKFHGEEREFPEIEKYKYMPLEGCRKYCNKSQFELIERLAELIK